jgi:hypothetical protein
MRLRPEEKEHYEAVFTSFPSRCATEVFQVVRDADGTVRRVPTRSAVRID